MLNAAADEPIPPSEHLRRALDAGADGHLSAIDLCRLRCTCTTLRSHAWRTLDFSSCHAAALKFFAGPSLDAKFRSLTKLNLSFCAGLRDTHLQNLASTLRSLTLDGCHGVTDAGVKLAAERCGRALEFSPSGARSVASCRGRPPTDILVEHGYGRSDLE